MSKYLGGVGQLKFSIRTIVVFFLGVMNFAILASLTQSSCCTSSVMNPSACSFARFAIYIKPVLVEKVE